MSLDERIARGLRAQAARRRELLDAGAEPVGWKIGFNLRQGQERLGLRAPVVGFLTSAGLLGEGSTYELGGARVIGEAEVGIHLGAPVAAGAGREEAEAAIAGLGPAIELTDLFDLAALGDLEEILEGNIFHRAVVFGEPVPGASLDGVTARVVVNGEERGALDARAATGDPAEIVLHVAGLLEHAGERLRPGDRIIAGVMPPFVFPDPGDRMQLDLGPLGSVALDFT